MTEALTAAREVGLEEWLRANITDELVRADESTVERLITGSRTHAVRRGHEMEAATQLLDSLHVPARVSRASRDWLRDLAADAPPATA